MYVVRFQCGGDPFQVAPAEPERHLTGNLISVDIHRCEFFQLIVLGTTIRISDIVKRISWGGRNGSKRYKREKTEQSLSLFVYNRVILCRTV